MIRTRVADMICTKTFQPRYGVEVNRGAGWRRLSVDGDLFVSEHRRDAEAMRAQVRAKARQEQKDKSQ